MALCQQFVADGLSVVQDSNIIYFTCFYNSCSEIISWYIVYEYGIKLLVVTVATVGEEVAFCVRDKCFQKENKRASRF